MIITMDGLSGAGKSCQAESLSKRRGYEVVNFYEKKVAHNIELSSLSNPCYHLIWLEEVSTAPLILDDPPFFSSAFFALFEKNELVIIDTFLEFLNASQLRPGASFCLKVDLACAAARRTKRDLKIEIAPESLITEWDSQKEAELFNFYDYLDVRLDYFHIIDGSQTPEKVTADILEKL